MTKYDVGAEKHIDIVFDGPPGPVGGRFVEVEDAQGCSICAGEWVEREDGFWVLRIPDFRSLDTRCQEAEDHVDELAHRVTHVTCEMERDRLKTEIERLRAVPCACACHAIAGHADEPTMGMMLADATRERDRLSAENAHLAAELDRMAVFCPIHARGYTITYDSHDTVSPPPRGAEAELLGKRCATCREYEPIAPEYGGPRCAKWCVSCAEIGHTCGAWMHRGDT